ncbi:DedA family protein [Clostridium oryzae]|uniref:SNARE associated golgi protein n=1 Tax=Clostridium oryzae TaxID=1450648 RepID=A0A1V4I9K6_9CLOT|nr:VTT domain-containing protein [Clostridium oryzae]OPJ56688.1 SNARE associated golgi protein [Clostridium oryzae]
MDTIIQDLTHHILALSPLAVYLILFFSAFLQMTVPPYPGDTILLLSGCFSSMGLKAIPAFTFGSYAAGTLFASYMIFILGYRYGNGLLKYRIVRKYFSRRNQRKIKKLILKYGVSIFFICKFVPGLNAVTILFGGIFKYNPLGAIISITTSSIIQNLIFFIIGRNIGYNVDKINRFLTNYSRTVWLIALVCGCIYLIFKLRGRKKKIG